MPDLSLISNMPVDKKCRRLHTLDFHTGGEPLRIITGGFPDLAGDTILDKQADCKSNFDYLRKSLIFEPRGHADMYAAVIVEAERADSDFGVFFMHNEGYSSMCGHAIIALAEVAFRSGLVKPTEPCTRMKIDVPAGQVTAYVDSTDGEIDRVYFDNVPSFVAAKFSLMVPSVGQKLKATLAFGGAYYSYVDISELPIALQPENYNRLIALGKEIKQLTIDMIDKGEVSLSHPLDPRLSFLYGSILIGQPNKIGNHSRNVCVFADGEVDRSATGSGVSGRIAIEIANNAVSLDKDIVIESIVDSEMTVSAIAQCQFGGMPAVIPRVSARAYISGRHEFIIDPEDPLKEGFIFR